MSFPTVAASATTADTTGNAVTVNMPAGIAAGNLLLVFVAHDTDANVTQSGGSDWTRIQHTANGANCQLSIFAKVAAGGDTLSLTDNADNMDTACVALRVTGHSVTDVAADIKKGTAATGSSATPDPPNCDATVAADYLWLECFAADDDDDTATYWSTGYTAQNQIQSASSTSSCLCAVAFLKENKSAENPGAMAMAATEEWVAQTLAIPPAATTDYTLALDTGAYALSGVAAALNLSRTLALDTGAFALSGNPALFPLGFSLPLDTGVFALAGGSALFPVNLSLILDTGAFALTGQPAAIGLLYTLLCETGVFGGGAAEPVSTPTRIYGPAILPTTDTLLYTVPANTTCVVKFILLRGARGLVRLSIGPDAVGTRVVSVETAVPNRGDTFGVYIPMSAGETLYGHASANVVVTIGADLTP